MILLLFLELLPLNWSCRMSPWFYYDIWALRIAFETTISYIITDLMIQKINYLASITEVVYIIQ